MPKIKRKKTQASVSPGRVTFLDGQGELPMLEVSTAWSTAEIYLNGAHVTNFKKKDEPALSQALLGYIVAVMSERLSFANRAVGVFNR